MIIQKESDAASNSEAPGARSKLPYLLPRKRTTHVPLRLLQHLLLLLLLLLLLSHPGRFIRSCVTSSLPGRADGWGWKDGRMRDETRDARRETRDARVPFQPLPSQGTAKVHHQLPLNSPFPLRVPDSRTRTRVPAFFFWSATRPRDVLYQGIQNVPAVCGLESPWFTNSQTRKLTMALVPKSFTILAVPWYIQL